MKFKFIYTNSISAVFAAVLMISCQDEVLVKTVDTTQTDELLAQIATLNNQLISVNEENNTISISNAQLEKTLQELMAQQESLNDESSSVPTQVHLTVNVLSASSAIFSNGGANCYPSNDLINGRAKGLTNSTVQVSQNGQTLAPSTSAAGLYLFTGLRPGQALVRISTPDHTGIEASIFLYIENEQDVAGIDAYNASVQFVVYPTAGPKASKMIGNAFANTSTLNDTLNRKFDSGTAFGTKANTFLATPGPWYDVNHSQSDNDGTLSVIGNIYNTNPTGREIQFETAPAGVKIYARPSLNNYTINNDEESNGYVTQITYSGLITSTTVKPDGTYELPIAAHVSYNDFSLFDDLLITTDRFVAPHTRLTASEGNFDGQKTESGSVVSNFKYYNNSNGTPTVYTGTGLATQTVAPATTLAITRRTISENYEYSAYIVQDGSSGSIGAEGLNLNEIPQAGQSVTRNLYFFPYTRKR